jgi:hypothetical protein
MTVTANYLAWPPMRHNADRIVSIFCRITQGGQGKYCFVLLLLMGLLTNFPNINDQLVSKPISNSDTKQYLPWPPWVMQQKIETILSALCRIRWSSQVVSCHCRVSQIQVAKTLLAMAPCLALQQKG